MKKLITLLLAVLLATTLSAQVIAVREFESDTFCLEFRTAVMSDLLVDELVQINGITVVERDKINNILGEQNFQNLGYTDPDTVKTQGKMLNADCMVYGNTTFIGDELVVTARLADVETGQILYTARMRCTTWTQFYDRLTIFAQELVNKIPSPNRFAGVWECDLGDDFYEIKFNENKKCEVTILSGTDGEKIASGTYSYSKDPYSGGDMLKVNARSNDGKNRITWSSLCTFTSSDFSSFNIQIKNGEGKTVRASFVKVE